MILTGVAIAAAIVVSLASSGGSGEDLATPVRHTDSGLWVDARAAACDDSRAAGAVSEARPWCTLEGAAAAAPDGVTVNVAGGNYGDVSFSGIQHGPKVVLRAAAGARPKLGYTVFDDASGIVLSGFDFAAPVDIFPGSNGQIGVLDSTFAGFRNVGVNIGPGAHDVLIAGNRFEDLLEEGEGAPGKGVNASGYGPEITGLRIVDNEFIRTHGGGIAVAGVVDSLIEGNEIAEVSPAAGSPIHADPLLIQGATRLTVRGNLIRDNEQAIVIFDGVSGLRFENNTVVGGQNYGVNFQGSAPGLRFAANTLWDNAFGGLLVQGALGPGARLRNNILQSIDGDGDVGGGEDFNLVERGPRAGSHDLRGSPRFTAPGRGDYSLAAGSRGIDAGSSTGTPRTDRLHRRRVDDPEVRNRGAGRRPYFDLGAEEHGAGAPR
jgi:hypothetical protein